MPQQTQYRPRFVGPYWLVRARATTIELQVYDDETGLVVTPTSATCTILDDSAVVQQTGAATVAGSLLTFVVLAATVPATLALEDSWQARWAVVIAGVTYTFINTAAVARWEPVAPCTVADLEDLHSDIRHFRTPERTWQQVAASALRTAWHDILRRLIRDGRRPDLVVSPHLLFDVHRARALQRLFADAATTLGEGRYSEQAKTYAAEFEQHYAGLRFDYDFDEDGVADDTEQLEAGESVIFAGTRDPNRWWYQ